jgi:adenylate cyclase
MTDTTKRRLAAILAADIAGYSRLIGENEEATINALRTHRRELIDALIEEYDGRVANTAGDSMLIEFGSVVDAIRCAASIQGGMVERNNDVAANRQISFRIGINVGDVVVIDGDMFGDAVNIAARLEGLSDPGGVLVSDDAYRQARNQVEIEFENDGEKDLKNISHPVSAWRWRGADTVQALSAATDRTPSGQPDKPSVVVLPLECMSDDRQHKFLADGLSEDITTLLARLPGFFVIARNSALSFKDEAPDAREVGRQLGVRYIVEGSLRPIGKKFRVTMQLIDGQSGQHIWAKRFDHPADTIFELQDEITSAIVSHLQPELTRVEFEHIQRRPPTDFDAWTYYQQASGLLAVKGWRQETFSEAADLYRKSIDLDDRFAPAFAGLSLLLSLGHLVGFVSEADEALAAADMAIILDNNNSEVLGFAGCAFTDLGYVDRGIETLEQALILDPSNAQALVALGSSHFVAGNVERAVDYISRGLEVSPRDSRQAVWRGIYALALGRLGDLEGAIVEARSACRHDSNLQNPRVILAALLVRADREAEASSALIEARRIHPDLSIREVEGLVGRRSTEMLRPLWKEASKKTA